MDKLPLRQPCDAYPWFNIVYTFGQLMALCVAGLRLARQRPTGPTRTLLPVHHLGRPFQVRPDSDLTSESGPTRTSPRVRLRRCIWPYADVASGPTRKSLSLHARLGLGRRLVSDLDVALASGPTRTSPQDMLMLSAVGPARRTLRDLPLARLKLLSARTQPKPGKLPPPPKILTAGSCCGPKN